MQPNGMSNEWAAYVDERIKAIAVGQDDIRTIIQGVIKVVEEDVARPLRKRIDDLEATSLHYAGIFSRGLSYSRGSLTTHGGSLWFCFRSTDGGEVPGDGDSPWQLVAKGGQLTGTAQHHQSAVGTASHNPKLHAIIGREGT